MNTLFPELLFLGPFFSPMLIRLALAISFLFLAEQKRKEKATDLASRIRLILFALSGVLLFVGFATQLAAFLGLLLVLDALFFEKPKRATSRLAYTLMAVMSLSLLITGAGAFAIDLPY